MLYSLFYHNQDISINLHILHTKESKELFVNKFEYIANFVSITHVQLHYYELNWDLVKTMGLPEYNSLPLTTYFRLLIPSILDNSIKQCLYLDTDVLILWSIAELFQLHIEHYACAGVKTNMLEQYMKNIWVNNYFNAGILYMNIDYRREHDISAQIISFITKYPNGLYNLQSIMWDQCGINYVCHGVIQELDPKWNCTPIWYKSKEIQNYSKQWILGYTIEQINQAQKDPIILHFAWTRKPCDSICLHPKKLIYYKYLLQSGLFDVYDLCKLFSHYITYIWNTDGLLYGLWYSLKHNNK